MIKKNRLSFSAISIEKDAKSSDAGGEPKRDPLPLSKPKSETGYGRKSGIKSSTYQYSKFGKRPGRHAPPRRSPYPDAREGKIPPPSEGVVRIIPLGGVEEIGKNMTAVEIGEDIIVIDAGMHFSTEETPGVDYVIPNTTYLEERKEKIRALIVTHGHLDHIGGVPIVLSRIGNPPVYSRQLSILLMRKRAAEFPQLPKMKENIVEKGETITCGKIKVLLLMTDSTNIENEGYALPEVKVHQGLENLIRRINGRVIIAAFASHITRLAHVVKIAEYLGKKVALEGRSMKTNIEVAVEAGYFKPKKGTLIPIEEVNDYPPNRIVILMTGAQGEEFSDLNRAANKSHTKFSLHKGDTIILSASIVPGNERAVERMKDGLARQGVHII